MLFKLLNQDLATTSKLDALCVVIFHVIFSFNANRVLERIVSRVEILPTVTIVS